MAADAKHEAGQDVTLAELETLYRGVVCGLKDHHFFFIFFMVKNLFPSPNDAATEISLEPGLYEVQSRDYFVELRADEQQKLDAFLSGIESHYNVVVHETASVDIPVLEGPSSTITA